MLPGLVSDLLGMHRQGPRFSIRMVIGIFCSDTVFVQLNQYSRILWRQCCLRQPCHLLTNWVSTWLNNFWDPFWARVTTEFIVKHSKIKVKIAVCFSISVVAIINLSQVVNTNWWKYEGKVREFLWQVGMMGARLEFLLINRTQPTQSCHQVGKYTRRPKLCESFQSDI